MNDTQSVQGLQRKRCLQIMTLYDNDGQTMALIYNIYNIQYRSANEPSAR